MNIETITANNPSDYTIFGWEVTSSERRRVGRSHHRTTYTLARDKSMRNYDLIAKLEGEYFGLKRTLRTYEPMEPGHVAIALAIFIIPGIIYITFKLKQKKRINEHNAEVQRQMNNLAEKARALR